jgi:hypothetical protein
MSDEKELLSLTELAEDAGISWRNYLLKAIRKGRDIFARLKNIEYLNVQSSRLTLKSLEKLKECKTSGDFDIPEDGEIHEHYIAWQPYWLLPKTELTNLLRDMPLWEIRRVTPTWVLIENSEGKFEEKEINEPDRKAYTSYIEPVLIDENNIFLVKTKNETHERETGESTIEIKQVSQENLQKRKVKSVKKEHTLLFLSAMEDCDKKQIKESTADQIWKYLKENLRRKYDAEEAIISTMTNFEMIIMKSSGNDESIDSESFARAIRRLREETSN